MERYLDSIVAFGIEDHAAKLQCVVPTGFFETVPTVLVDGIISLLLNRLEGRWMEATRSLVNLYIYIYHPYKSVAPCAPNLAPENPLAEPLLKQGYLCARAEHRASLQAPSNCSVWGLGLRISG